MCSGGALSRPVCSVRYPAPGMSCTIPEYNDMLNALRGAVIYQSLRQTLQGQI